jgi:tripartite-type tricarboxylate transporter receptor subunit TctC
MRKCLGAGLLIAVLSFVNFAHAEEWPTRPVTWIVPLGSARCLANR